MNNKRMILIPSISKFQHSLGISGRKINAGIFIPTRNNNPNASLLESVLYQFKHLNIIGWFTNEVGYQRGAHRQKKLNELCSKGEIDLVICYTKEDIERYEVDLGNSEKSIVKCDIAFYCIKECVLLKTGKLIPLS